MIDASPPDAPERLLALALDRLERSARPGGTIDTLRARGVLDAAALLDLEAPASRAEALLAAASPEDFTRGAITNFSYDAAALERLRQPRPRAALDRDFPTFRREDVSARASCEEATRLAWEGSAAEALAFAPAHPRGLGETPLHVEVALTCAVRGDFDSCRTWIAGGTVSPPHTHDVRLALVIELARAERWKDASHELRALGPLEPWTATCLALGLAGRCPWSIYSYADY